MASAWPEEETFVCPVCLETLKDPTTLPCGHTYCMPCIQGHWDRGSTEGRYTCPQCRTSFDPRPSLARSTVLVEAMEKLRAKSLREQGNPYGSISSAPPSVPIYLEICPDPTPPSGGGPRPLQASVYPALPSVGPPPCPQHQRPLDLYCRDDGTYACDRCSEQAHKGHRVVKPEEERKEKQRELLQMKAEIQRRAQDTRRTLAQWPHAAKQQKALAQALRSEAVAVLSELGRSVDLVGSQVEELLSAHEASLGSRLEGDVQRLEQEEAQLRRKAQELEGLEGMQDHRCFLKNFATLDPLTLGGVEAGPGTGLAQEEELVAGVRSSMAHLRDALQDLCKDGLARIFRAVNDGTMAPPVANGGTAAEVGGNVDAGEKDAQNQVPALPQNPPTHRPSPVYEMSTKPPPTPPRPALESPISPSFPLSRGHASSTPPPPPLPSSRTQNTPPITAESLVTPEPKTREEMLKFRFEPIFDPNTGFRHIRLSDGDRKATLRADSQNPADHPERFQFWRQVLCKEPVAGSPFYWEVEWTGQKITIGVTYKEMDRKSSDDQSRLGFNALSWGLYWSGSGFSFWHQGQETPLGSAKARRVGVYLDQHAGVLAFYRVTKDQAQLIHSVQTQFSGPLYPGFRFWSGVGSTVSLCQLD